MNSKRSLLPSTLPSYTVPSVDKDDEHTLRKSQNVRRLSWGMFQVAYGEPEGHISLNSLWARLRELRRCAPGAIRLFLEIYSTARTPVTVHILAAALLIIAPAFSLYLSASILGVVEETVLSRTMTESHVNILQVLVLVWLFVAVMNTMANRILIDTAFRLKGHLRAHFLPQLVDAMRSLPEEYGFETEVPGFRFFHEVITRFRNFLTIVGEVGVLVTIISMRGIHEARLLAFFSLMLPAVMLLKPVSGVGGAGYVFWATNHNFYYLAALYKMAFSREIRSTLARNGLCPWLSDEYKRVSRELGYLNIETMSMQVEIQVRWYWDLIHSIIVEYPLAVCALMLPWSDPLSSLVTMVLVQHASMTLQQSIYLFRGSQAPDTLAEVLGWAERLYDTIGFDSIMNHGTAEYPSCTRRSSPKGMKITFHNVSFRHHEEGPLTVSGAEFEIPAGSLAVVVGANGSGKSSLLNLIPRVLEPVAGEILIDDRPLAEYNLESVRGAMACLGQDEEMYPLTLRQNMLMSAARDVPCNPEVLATAAQLGCASELIDRLPLKYETVLDPAPVTAQSMQGCGNGYIADAAMDELDANGPSFQQTCVSGGERQRLAATRLFSRLLERQDRVRLIVCDEATGALDACAERDILRNMKELGAGKATRIFVTHRFGDLVKEADIILVMKEGRVVQQGTHAELMQEALRSGGCREYADMYQAQADGFL
ncbi:P-loop containing nucleoside triphosphate hydrolase protein [Mycena vitilis]|nr:P-loop containing nucleoside triphosphate hydrolase protein [Mycena vitilis]